MPDAATIKTIRNGSQQIVVHLTNISDGSGESAAIKLDKSALLANDGAAPASLDIEQVEWNIQGFTSVRLLWDHDTDEVALVLSGSGYKDFRGKDDSVYNSVGNMRVSDGRGTGGTGDILLTTAGAVSGATYDITLWVFKNPD